jgi:hypothetical protein
LTDIGHRTKVWVAPKTGHAVPAGVLPEAFKWLDEGAPQRRELAKKYPATRVPGDAAPNRDEAAKLLLAEGKERLKAPATLYSGLMQLQGCMTRWKDVPAGAEARKLLLQYEAREEKPWEEEDVAEQRKFILASARALGAYASGPLPDQYALQRKEMATEAIRLWAILLQDSPEGKVGQEAKASITELKKLLDGMK